MIDLEQFMKDGYLILRGVLPPEQFEPLRQSAEEAFRRRFPEGVPAGCFNRGP